MADIHDINIVDAKKFLLLNKAQLPANNNEIIYIMVKKLLERDTTNYKGAPSSIVKWLLAYNVIQSGTFVPRYVKYEIYDLSLSERNILAKSLGMKGNNTENIIDILRFLHKLDGDLDFANNYDLYLPLLLNSDFEQVINILEANPKLKNLVKELLPEIIENNIGKKKYFPRELHDFLDNLIKLNYLDLIIDILKIINNDSVDYSNIYYNYLDDFTTNNMLKVYYELAPKNFRVTRIREHINSILKKLDDSNEDKNVFYYLIYNTLKYSILIKDKAAIKYIIDTWRDKTSVGHKEFQKIMFHYEHIMRLNMNKLIIEAENYVYNKT
jgi:hypothetical protein